MEGIENQNVAKRVIVLIPDGLTNNNDLAHTIYWMAERENLSVLYLVVVDDSNNMLAVTRSMVTMKAMTSVSSRIVEAKLIDTGHWLETLGTLAGPGDIIICQEEHYVVTGSYKEIPADEFLSGRVDVPIRTITGYTRPFYTPAKKRLPELVSLLVFLMIIALFSGAQVQVNQVFHGSFAKLLVFLSFCLELGIAWAWYKFADR